MGQEMKIDHTEFDTQNRNILLGFIKDAEKHKDDLSGSVLATMAQIIVNLRIAITKVGKSRGWVTPEEIIDSQIEVLRNCIIDLSAYKERLTKGVTPQ